MPVYPVLLSPYYQNNIYSSYIPLAYSTTNHPIPISQISYPQEDDYYHRYLDTIVPLHRQLHTNIPNSTPINNNSKIKIPINVQTYISQNNLNETLINDMKKSLNQNIEESDHTLPIVLNNKEPIQNIYKNDEKSIRNKKLLDSLDNTSTSIKAEAIELNNSQEVQQSLSTTGDQLHAYNLTEIIDFHEKNNITSTPMSITTEPQIFLDKNYRVSDELITKSPYISSVTGQPNAIIETESLTTSKNIFNQTKLFSKENKESNESGEIHHNLNLLNNINITTESTDITKTSIKNEKNSTVLINTTQTPKTLITLSSLIITSSNKTTIRVDPYDSSIQMRSAHTILQPNKVNRYDNQSNLISSSTAVSSPPSTTMSKTILSYKTSQSPTFKTTLLQELPEEFISNISTNSNKEPFKNKTIETTINENNVSLLPSLQLLNDIKTTTSMLIDTKTEQNTSIMKNVHKYNTNIKQNTIIPNYYRASPKSSSINTISVPSQKFIKQEPILRTFLPSNIFSKSNLNHTVTEEKSNTYEDGNTDHNLSKTTKESRKNSLKSITIPTESHDPIETDYSLVTTPNYLKYRKTTDNQNQYIDKSIQTPQTIKESELWYSSIHKQNIPKKELNDEQINFLLNKLIKLLKPEIEKQTITQESMARFVAPKLGDQEKFVYIILPLIKNAAKNMENGEQTEKKS